MTYMFKDEKEFVELKANVLGYLQRDIEKLIDMHYLDASFMNFAGSGKSSGTTWIYLRVNFIYFKDADDLGTEAHAKVAYPIEKELFTRDPAMMRSVDACANISGKQDKLSDRDLVKLRILNHIFQICQDFDTDGVPLDLPVKGWITLEYLHDGKLIWNTQPNAPGV